MINVYNGSLKVKSANLAVEVMVVDGRLVINSSTFKVVDRVFTSVLLTDNTRLYAGSLKLRGDGIYSTVLNTLFEALVVTFDSTSIRFDNVNLTMDNNN